MSKALERLIRQAKHNIGGNILKARRKDHLQRLFGLLGVMQAAEGGKFFVVHRLHPQGDAVKSHLFQPIEQSRGGAFGVELDGAFCTRFEPKGFLHPLYHLRQPLLAQ